MPTIINNINVNRFHHFGTPVCLKLLVQLSCEEFVADSHLVQNSDLELDERILSGLVNPEVIINVT